MSEPQVCDEVVNQLQATFDLVALGNIKYLLGIEVVMTRDTVFFSQANYISEVLRRFSMSNANPCATPEASSRQDDLNDAATDLLYREAVGALQYLVSGSRPDLARAV